MEAHHSQRKTILLMGPPNVGKSVLFNYFTGMEVSCANYAGTTVEYAVGSFQGLKRNVTIVDVPGTYTLEASNEAERVAVEMLNNPEQVRSAKGGHCSSPASECPISVPNLVLCVLDAVNLESSLYLLSYILRYSIPVVAALNRIDVAERKGIQIDHKQLSSKLGIPVIPTVAPTGEGAEKLKQTISEALHAEQPAASFGEHASLNGWGDVEELVKQVQTRSSSLKRHKPADELLTQPWPGLPIALLIILTAFGLIVGLGMGTRQLILLPVFRGYVFPFITWAVESVIPSGMVRQILIGEYGFLIKGIEWPFTLVFPYVISFYLAMAILEDSGYLPRLGALLDGLFNRFGMSGSSVIPLLLGYGCAIPAIMATRTLNTKKERLIVVSIICLTIPCISQTGAILTLLAEQSLLVVGAMVLFSLFIVISAGVLLDRLLQGPLPALVIELPVLLPPRPSVIGKKVLIRIRRYISDGALPMVGAVGIASLLYETGIMAAAGRLLSPLVTGWLRLPEEAAVPLILGIMRRELSILPLLEMELTSLQLFTGALVGLFYIPCIAVVASLAREFKLKTAVFILLGTSATAFLIGGLIANIGSLFM